MHNEVVSVVAELREQRERQERERRQSCVDGKQLARLEKRVRDAEIAIERARRQSITAKAELQHARDRYATGNSCIY